MHRFISTSASSLGLFALLTLFGCGADITAPVVGTYHGRIVAGAVIDTDYTVTVAAVDGDTLSISGADFQTFEVDVMDVGGEVTQVAGDYATTLAWVDGLLSFAHTAGSESVTFDGTQSADGARGDTGGDNAGDTGGDTGGDNGGDTGADSGGPSSIAAGDYLSAALGPVVDPTYTLNDGSLALTYDPLGFSFSGEQR